ncbi:hypothetical protein FKM82_031080 [Ascaphus truei]
MATIASKASNCQGKILESIEYLENFIEIAKSSNLCQSLAETCIYLGDIFNARNELPKKLTIPISLLGPTFCTSTAAFIDSGAGGNFVDQVFTKQNHIPLARKISPIALVGIDGRTLNPAYISLETRSLTLFSDTHNETLSLDVIHSPGTPVTLGLPWLQKHNPRIDWTSRSPIHWETRSEEPTPPGVTHLQLLASSTTPTVSKGNLPEPYSDFLDIFSKTQSEVLPPPPQII